MLTLEEVLWPLINLDEMFSLLYVSSKCNPLYEISFITKTFNEVQNRILTEIDIENCLNKLTSFKYHSFAQKVIFLDEKLKSKPRLCEPKLEVCEKCTSQLELHKKSQCVFFGINSIENGILVTKKCSSCSIIFHVDKYEKHGELHSYFKSEYLCTSSESVFEVIILINLKKE